MIPKFTPNTKRARLTFERLAKIIVRDSIIAKKKDVFTKMLYNWEVVLAWDFSKIEKVKKKVALLQKV